MYTENIRWKVVLIIRCSYWVNFFKKNKNRTCNKEQIRYICNNICLFNFAGCLGIRWYLGCQPEFAVK